MLWIDLFVHCCRSTSWWPSPIPPRQHETWWDYLPPNTNSAPRNRGPERYVTLSDTAGRKQLYTYLYTTVQQTNSICAQKLSTYQNYMKVYLHTFTCWQDLLEWIKTQHCIVKSIVYSITWHNLQYSYYKNISLKSSWLRFSEIAIFFKKLKLYFQQKGHLAEIQKLLVDFPDKTQYELEADKELARLQRKAR